MFGGSNRALLLLPLLLSLAAYACGGSSGGAADSPVANAGAGASASGASEVGGNAAGAATNPPSATGGSGGVASDGTVPNAAACPAATPSAGSPCAHDDLGPERCLYARATPGDCVPIIATCSSSGTWILRLEPDYSDDTCSDEPESTCPDTLPAVASTCQLEGTECQYNPGAVVICSVCRTWLAGVNGYDCSAAGAGGQTQ